MSVYTFQRGETIQLALDALSDPGAVVSVAAKLRKLRQGHSALETGAPLAGVFAVTEHAAEGETPAGWTLTIEDSTGIAVGHYMADARLVVGSGIIITDSVRIAIEEPATVTAGEGVP